MGACDFYQYQSGNDLDTAFKEALDKAFYDHGHAGYSGTLAEKTSVRLRASVETKQQAKEFAEKDLANNDHDKWGPAWAVRIKGTKEFLFYGYASS